MKTLKKRPQKLLVSGPKLCFSIANQPKSHILFHKNGSLRDFFIMTLIGTFSIFLLKTNNKF